jgi:hypothetical protein
MCSDFSTSPVLCGAPSVCFILSLLPATSTSSIRKKFLVVIKGFLKFISFGFQTFLYTLTAPRGFFGPSQPSRLASGKQSVTKKLKQYMPLLALDAVQHCGERPPPKNIPS